MPTTKYRTALALVMLLGLASACQQTDTSTPASLPVLVPDPVVDLARYPAPGRLDDLTLAGDARREHGDGRLYYYQSGQPGLQAQVQIYPMPGGWDVMPPKRLVGGQYGVIRQQVLERLNRRGYGTIHGDGEGLFVSEALAYPIAEVLLTSRSWPGKPARILMLGVAPPVFVRVERDVPAQDAQAAMARTRQWLIDLLQEFEANSQASNTGRERNDSRVDSITVAAMSEGA